MAACRESSCAVTAIGISPSFLILGFVGPTQAAAIASAPCAIGAPVVGDGGQFSFPGAIGSFLHRSLPASAYWYLICQSASHYSFIRSVNLARGARPASLEPNSMKQKRLGTGLSLDSLIAKNGPIRCSI
jgi:hypothetical protein